MALEIKKLSPLKASPEVDFERTELAFKVQAQICANRLKAISTT
jgi:hypothetical protein